MDNQGRNHEQDFRAQFPELPTVTSFYSKSLLVVLPRSDTGVGSSEIYAATKAPLAAIVAPYFTNARLQIWFRITLRLKVFAPFWILQQHSRIRSQQQRGTSVENSCLQEVKRGEKLHSCGILFKAAMAAL